MATAGPRYPGTTSSEVGPSGDNDWISTSPIGADDGSEAQITAATYDAGDHSYRLKATNFGFAADIPTGSTINGITVEIDRRCFAGAAQDQEVRLYDSTATLVGDDKQTATAWPATLGIATYGGSGDTWAAGLDADDVRSANFGVALIVLADAANTDIGVDFIRVTIDYTPVFTATGAITVPAATVSGTGVMHPSGTGAITVPAPTTSGSGAEVFTATGAASVPAPTVSGTGDHSSAEPPSGTGAVTVPASTVSGTGLHTANPTGTGSVTVPAATVSGAGAEVLTATGAITTPAATVNATGTHLVSVTGTGAITVAAASVSGSGTGGDDINSQWVAHIGRVLRAQMAQVMSPSRKGRGGVADDDDDDIVQLIGALVAALL